MAALHHRRQARVPDGLPALSPNLQRPEPPPGPPPSFRLQTLVAGGPKGGGGTPEIHGVGRLVRELTLEPTASAQSRLRPQ